MENFGNKKLYFRNKRLSLFKITNIQVQYLFKHLLSNSDIHMELKNLNSIN